MAKSVKMTDRGAYYYYTPPFTEEERESLKDVFGKDLFGKSEGLTNVVLSLY